MKLTSTPGFAFLCGMLMFAGCSKEVEQVQPQSGHHTQNASQPGYNGDQYGGAIQNGNGAYVQKQTRNVCINNYLTALNGGQGCTELSQTKWMVTPSGIATAFWEGSIPEGLTPPEGNLYSTSYEEFGNKYSAVTTYDSALGTMKLVLTNKK